MAYFYSIIEDSDVYQRYYEYYGTSGCKAKEYVKKRLDEGMKDNSKSDIFYNKLSSFIQVGQKISLKSLKKLIKSINDNLHITSSPKASIIEDYFDVKRVKFKDPDTGERINGYEILGIRKAG